MAYSALIDDLEKQFAENPRRVFARLANEYRKAGDLERAIAYCRAHIPTAPSYISGYIVLGQALFESQRFEEARQAFETALNLDPENLIALRQLGDVARQNGDNESARAWYQRLLEVDPQNEEIAAQLELLAPRERTESGSWWPSDNAVGFHGMMGGGPARPDAEIPAEMAHEPLPELSMPDGAMPVQGDAVAEQEPLDQYVTDSELFAAEGYATHMDPVGEDQVLGIEHFELGMPAGAPAKVPTPADSFAQADMSAFSRDAAGEADSTFAEQAPDASAVAPMYDPFVGRGGPDQSAEAQSEAAGAGVTPAFVTETMADLYLSQGFTGEAAAIYRQLIEHRPDDEKLRQRLAEAEGQLAAPVLDAGTIADSPRRGNVRSFFGSLASKRRPTRAAGSGNGTGSRHQPLFDSAAVASADDLAARRLAGAFSEEYREGNRASTLDALFSDGVDDGARSEDVKRSANVTFDEFFAGGEVAPSAGSSRPDAKPASGDEGKSDLETFHAWLGGLKQ